MDPNDGSVLTPHCWWRSCVTWFWGTCRSLSLSGTGRIPCAGSGEKRGGAPTQDSPANPWDCGLARDHFLNQSCRVREKRESTRVLDEFHFCRFLLPPFLFHSVDKHYRDNPECPDTSDDAAQPLAVFLSFFLEWKLKKAMWHFAAWMHAAVTLWFSWIGRLPQGFSKNYTLLTCHFSESIVFKWRKRATSTAHSLWANAFSLSGGMTDWECWFCYRSDVKTNYWSIKDTQTEVPLWPLDM